MRQGYIKLHRQCLDNGMLKNHKLWVFWSWCLMKASYQDHKQMVGFQEVHLKAGQFIFGRKAAAQDLNMSEQSIRTCKNRLQTVGNLTSKSTNKFTVITVVNWHTYQQQNNSNNQQVTSKQPASNHKQEGKEVKNNIYTSNFLTFWEKYPKKIGKGAAFKSYKNILNPKPSLGMILKSITDQKKTEQWQNKKYIPNPAVWINQRRWEDEIETKINNTPHKLKTLADREAEEKELFANK